ncbi:hypothetical protein Tco_0558914 [Tanacetum coccineum]
MLVVVRRRVLVVLVVMAAVVWRGAGDDGDDIMGVALWWAAVGRQPEEGVARGGEWIWGSGGSGHEDDIWFRPERSPENFSGGGMVAGNFWERERDIVSLVYDVHTVRRLISDEANEGTLISMERVFKTRLRRRGVPDGEKQLGKIDIEFKIADEYTVKVNKD